MEKIFCRVALIFIAALVGVEVSAQASDTIWQLDLQNGRPVNCTLAFTRVERGDKGQPILVADTRGNKSDWHSCITLPRGLLKAGKDYVVTVDYEVIKDHQLTPTFMSSGDPTNSALARTTGRRGTVNPAHEARRNFAFRRARMTTSSMSASTIKELFALRT